MKSKQIVFRVSDELHQKIKVVCAEKKITITNLFLTFIEKFLSEQ